MANEQLKSFIDRIERLLDEKKTISDDIKDVYDEAAGVGFDKKILRIVIKLRAEDESERELREAEIETYMAALGSGSGVSE
jgi:uncharacterized protein (UPF0335 family)